MSILTKNQTRLFRKTADNLDMIVKVRHDDQCGNGHNTFSITMDAWTAGKPRNDSNYVMGGCCHDEVARHFPKLAHLIQWHLCSTDGPMHYIANTLYHAKEISKHQDKFHTYLTDGELGIRKTSLGIFSAAQVEAIRAKYGAENIDTKEWFSGMAKTADFNAARRSACWPDATESQLTDEKALNDRLPEMLEAFRVDVQTIGLVF